MYKDEQILTVLEYALSKKDSVMHDWGWAIPDLPETFNISLRKKNAYEQNIELKKKLNKLLANNTLREEVIEWFLKRWGGITAIGEKTLKKYYTLEEPNFDTDLNYPFDGIASSSKVLNLLNPLKYCIYDARVAYSLNAIDLLYNKGRGLVFPVPPGRNQKLAFIDIITLRRLQYMKSLGNVDIDTLKAAKADLLIPKSEAYFEYMELLRMVVTQSRGIFTEGYEVEMILFTYAEELADDMISAQLQN